MDAVVAAGANRIDGIEYESSELRKYKDQARDAAAKAAREKAEGLVVALGNQMGNTYSIEEVQQTDDYYPLTAGLPNVAAPTRTKLTGPSTAPGELTVKASVTVRFE